MNLESLNIDRIPVEDPEAALRFCRALASQVTCGAAHSVDVNGATPSGENVVASLPQARPELSVVIPVYNEVGNISPLYDRLVNVLEGQRLDFEIVFVDDGSSDGSLKSLNELEQSDSRVRVIELARNFGHQVAITAGLDYARGNAIAVMDADLQDPPEVLPIDFHKI